MSTATSKSISASRFIATSKSISAQAEMTLPAETLKSSLSAGAGIPATLDISDDLSRSLKPFTIIQISCSFSHAAGLWRWCQPPALNFESPALNADGLHSRTCLTPRVSERLPSAVEFNVRSAHISLSHFTIWSFWRSLMWHYSCSVGLVPCKHQHWLFNP